jgi:hypothetical protein
MDTIIAGNFEIRQRAEDAIRALWNAGAPRSDVCAFALNAEGQHHGLTLGGDVAVDPQAEGGQSGGVRGAIIGTAVGAGIGLAATPLAPIVAPALVLGAAAAGAYAGGLAGAVSSMGKPNEEAEEAPPPRPAGVLVAVRADTDERERLAADVMRAQGARDIERAQGTWENGRWVDFDPVKGPEVINPDPNRRTA